MLTIPTGERELISFANEMIEMCSVSQAMRASYYRLLNVIAETGRYDGTKSLVNMMNTHLERTASHLFSPVELKFAIDYDNGYDANQIKRGEVIAKHLTRQWEKSSTDILYGRGVFEGLKYGAAVLKQWATEEGEEGEKIPSYEKDLVLPWNFGVFREDKNDIDKQDALLETTSLTGPEVWQRIYRFPNAKKLYEQIMTHARSGETSGTPDSFFHQVLSTSQLQTGVSSNTRPLPGGIVQIGNDPNYSIMGPTVGAPTVKFHELWVKGEDDYKTIQMIEPDVLITKFKLSNLLIKGSRRQPYRLIQPNPVTNWFWGRSELVDLIEPQGLLAQWLDDLKRLIGLQIDKIIGFSGENQITDEVYAAFRTSGYMNLGMGGKAEDLTPKFPAELLPCIKFMLEMINTLGSFPEIMQGKGEPGVRAGVHANTLLKTASPTLRDRALLVERQCAISADLTLELMEAKEDRKFWTASDKPEDAEKTGFMISDLPSDYRVTVDSHSSSPIFADESQQLIFALRKAGDVDGEYAIDNLPLPNKEAAKAGLRNRAKAKQEQTKELLAKFPEEAGKQAAKSLIGGSRR
jgi:hypothetical protein